MNMKRYNEIDFIKGRKSRNFSAFSLYVKIPHPIECKKMEMMFVNSKKIC